MITAGLKEFGAIGRAIRADFMIVRNLVRLKLMWREWGATIHANIAGAAESEKFSRPRGFPTATTWVAPHQQRSYYADFLLRRISPTIPVRPVPSKNIVAGSGTGTVPLGVPTSLPSPSAPTLWKRTKIELAIWASVNPAKDEPLTEKLKLCPGARPSLALPPLKLPELPVVHPKSSTALLN